MIIDIPFTYLVAAIPPRKVNARSFMLTDTHQVEIREVDSEDTELVARRPARNDGKVPPVEYRYFDGRLWRDIVRHGSHDTMCVVGRDDAFQVLATWEMDSVPYGVEKVDQLVARKVISSEKQARISEIEADAAEYALVGGRLMQPTPEPVYEVSHGETYLRVEHEVQEARSRTAVSTLWRADEYDRIVAELGEGKKLMGDAPFEVFRPDFLKWDRERITYFEALQHDLKWYARELEEAPKEVMMLWADLRDALADLDENDEDGIRATLPMARVLHEKAMEARKYQFQTPFEGTFEAIETWERADVWRSALDPIGITP